MNALNGIHLKMIGGRYKILFSTKIKTKPNYYKYQARLYFDAAEAADRVVGHYPGYDLTAPEPVMTLCAHSIELSIKAFLLDNCVSEDEVKKLGHNLVACWDRCVECGADANYIDVAMLKTISDTHKSGRLRYGEKSKDGLIPAFGPFSKLCEKCLDLCGAPSYHDIFST